MANPWRKFVKDDPKRQPPIWSMFMGTIENDEGYRFTAMLEDNTPDGYRYSKGGRPLEPFEKIIAWKHRPQPYRGK